MKDNIINNENSAVEEDSSGQAAVLYKNPPHVFYKYDYKKDKYQFLSPSVKELSGYHISEINELGFDKIIRKQVIDKNVTHSVDGSSKSEIEERFVTYHIETKDGEKKWVEDNSFTIINPQGERTMRIGFLKDISANMRDDKIKQVIADILTVANSEKNLEELFKFIHFSIKKLMKADNLFIAYHHRDSDLLSFPYFVDEKDDDSSSKKLGKGLTEYVLRTGKSILIDRAKDEELTAQGEIELIGPQSEIWLGVPLKIKDKTIGVLVVQDYDDPATYGEEEKQILDVISYPISRAIERKMVDEEREEIIKQLQDLNKSKDQLFSLISHDLRSPFNSLLGFADVLTSEYDTLTQRDIKEYINVINDSAKTLFAMTNNLLHYSRLELEKFEYKPAALNLSESVKIVLEAFADAVKKKDLLVKNNIPEDYTVWADEQMLNITLSNIISNAIKYSNEEGEIDIDCEVAEGSQETTKMMYSVIVKDEGVGIPFENMDKIKKREMFTTLGTRREFGSGLGLLLATDFTRINKGELEILSVVDKGTTVQITIPAFLESLEENSN